MHPRQQHRDSKRLTLALASLVSVLASAAFLHGLMAPPSIESQVGTALGCRAFDQVLILTLNPDGYVRWPDGSICTVEESQLLIPAWCGRQESPVLALLAEKDTPVSLAHPLLATVQDLGIRRAILAVSQGNALTLISDAKAKSRP